MVLALSNDPAAIWQTICVDVALVIGQLYDDPIRTLFTQNVVLKPVPVMITNMSNIHYIYKSGSRNKLPLMVIDVPAIPDVGEIDKTDPIVHGVKRNSSG
jgi:hypothetical protein